ncbi:MAG: hypothetical protein RLZZ330_1150, partial [Actinomycetota bacterium]
MSPEFQEDPRKVEVLKIRDFYFALSTTPWDKQEPLYLNELLQTLNHA